MTAVADHFSAGGAAYAQFRPTYPPELAAALADLAPARDHVWDVGCGTGQLSVLLARHFTQVTATDISAGQIENATVHPKVRYAVASATQSALTQQSIDLITVAQAAHWFDLPAFFVEAHRLARPGAAIALISYGVMAIDDAAIDARFQRFYWQEIHHHWPPERAHVETGYRDLPFPFVPLPAPTVAIVRDWSLDALIGYVETWSATKTARAADDGATVDRLRDDLARLWGVTCETRRVTWPIALRLGGISAQP